MPLTEYGELTISNLTENGEAVANGFSETGAFVFGAATTALLKQVSDFLFASDEALRHKPSALIVDGVSAADILLNNKSVLPIVDLLSLADLFAVLKNVVASDSLSLQDSASTPSRVLSALDAVGALDGSFVDKVLFVSESFSVAEVVDGEGGKRKTKLFLVLGDLALQLSRD